MSKAYYHHPEDEYLSIEFVNSDFSKIKKKEKEYKDSATAVLSYDFDRETHVLYVGTEPPSDADEIEMDADALVADVSSTRRVIAVRALRAFSSILEEKQLDEGEQLRAYKDLEAEGIAEALNRVEWDGTVTEVGGRLLSNLILRHPFPNANHRTGLIILEAYTAAHLQEFNIPKMHNSEYQWKEWADEYIRESKRLLTVRRNAPRFHYLQNLGCETVERKGGIRIDLGSYNLYTDINQSHAHYAKRHEQLCQDLTREIVCRQGNDRLTEIKAIPERKFAEILRNST